MRGVLIERAALSPGERGTLETAKKIRTLIREGRGSPLIRTTAEDVLEQEGVPERDHRGEAEALFEFVREHLRFTSDPYGVEMLTTAEGLLEDHTFADCDEFVILLGSLLESIGRRVRLKIVRRGSKGPWQHVYLEVRIKDRWIPADATNAIQPFGWEVPHGSGFTVDIDGPFAPVGLGSWGAIIGGLLSSNQGSSGGGSGESSGGSSGGGGGGGLISPGKQFLDFFSQKKDRELREDQAKEDRKFKKELLKILQSSTTTPAVFDAVAKVLPAAIAPGSTPAAIPSVPMPAKAAAPTPTPTVPAPTNDPKSLTFEVPRDWLNYAAAGLAAALLLKVLR